MWAHWNGRYKVSEKRFLHGTEVTCSLGILRYVARQVPRHSKSSAGELFANQLLRTLDYWRCLTRGEWLEVRNTLAYMG